MLRFSVLAVLAFLGIVTGLGAEPTSTIAPVGTILLPGVEGRIDHFSIDLKGSRLFVCALGNNSVEVVDLRTSTVIHSIHGLSEPQGVFYAPEVDKIYVTNAGTGVCDVYDGTTYALLKRVDLGGDADNLHYDASARRLYASAGNALAVIDVSRDEVVDTIGLPGHPEGFVLDRSDQRVFVNVPLPSRSAFVVDRARDAVAARWPVGGLLADAFSNFPISLDEREGRLFVGTRVPASLKVLDVTTGKIVAAVGTDGDADDIFYDPDRRRVYVSCGAGFIDVFQQLDPDHYREMARIATAPGGRTSLWVPELNRLFVAIPRSGDLPAQVRVYSVP